MLKLSRWFLCAALATCTWALPDAKLKLRAPVVVVKTAVVTVGFVQPYPDVATVSNGDSWVVVVKTADEPAGRRVRVNSVAPLASYPQSGQIALTLETPVPESAFAVDIMLLTAGRPDVTWRPKERTSANVPKPPRPCFSGLSFNPAPNRDKADVYLSGLWVPAVGSKPTYTIDSNMTLPLCSTQFWNLLQLDGKVNTDAKNNADPDSFSAGISMARKYPWQIAPRQYVDFKWGMADWEFSRKDEAFNFTSAPAVTWAAALAPGVDIEVPVSFELGTNLRNQITEIRNGYGTIARFAPGAKFYAVSPPFWGHAKATWTSSYVARVLLTREPFVDYRRTPTASIARGTRHYVENSLDFKVNDYFGFTLKHQYGSLPPAFEFVDHKATVGLVVMWSWKQ